MTHFLDITINKRNKLLSYCHHVSKELLEYPEDKITPTQDVQVNITEIPDIGVNRGILDSNEIINIQEDDIAQRSIDLFEQVLLEFSGRMTRSRKKQKKCRDFDPNE